MCDNCILGYVAILQIEEDGRITASHFQCPCCLGNHNNCETCSSYHWEMFRWHIIRSHMKTINPTYYITGV